MSTKQNLSAKPTAASPQSTTIWRTTTNWVKFGIMFRSQDGRMDAILKTVIMDMFITIQWREMQLCKGILGIWRLCSRLGLIPNKIMLSSGIPKLRMALLILLKLAVSFFSRASKKISRGLQEVSMITLGLLPWVSSKDKIHKACSQKAPVPTQYSLHQYQPHYS